MKRLLFRLLSRLGTLLTHRQRRFLLDRLGLARLAGSLARDEFETIELPDGTALFLNPLLHAHLARDGMLAYEEEVLEAIRAHLEPGDVFYDVGANVGVFSFVAAGRVGAEGAVHAFEPEENNLVCLRRSLEASEVGHLEIHVCALGAEDGTMTFDRRGGAFSGRLVEPGGASEGAAVRVEVRSVDSLVDEGLRPPDLVKVDVEGGEGGVLEGMARTLEVHRPVVLCEMHAFNPEGMARAAGVLRRAGYRARGLDGASAPLEGDPSRLPHFVLARPT